MDRLEAMSVFTAVVQRGSFTAAAKALGVPKSTVSRRIAELEAELAVTLLHRTTRRVRTTELGKVFFDGCLRVIEEARVTEARLHEHRGQPRGLLRASANPLFARLLLGRVSVAYLARWPEASLEIVVTERPVALVEEGFDVAIRVGPVHDPDLVARKLAPAARAICGSPAYLAARGVPQRPADLADHECINGRPTWRLAGPGGPVEIAVNGRLSITDVFATREAVLGGAGLAQLPMVLVRDDLAAGRLVAVLEPWTRRASTWVHAVFPSASRGSPNVRAFLDVLVEHMPDGVDGRRTSAAEPG